MDFTTRLHFHNGPRSLTRSSLFCDFTWFHWQMWLLCLRRLFCFSPTSLLIFILRVSSAIFFFLKLCFTLTVHNQSLFNLSIYDISILSSPRQCNHHLFLLVSCIILPRDSVAACNIIFFTTDWLHNFYLFFKKNIEAVKYLNFWSLFCWLTIRSLFFLKISHTYSVI